MLPDYKADCRNDFYETTVTDLGLLYISFLKKNGYDLIHWNPAYEYPPFDEDVLVFAIGKKGTGFEGTKVNAIMHMTDKNRFGRKSKLLFEVELDLNTWYEIGELVRK